MSTATVIRSFVHDIEHTVVVTVSTPTEFFALLQLYAVNSSGRTELISSYRYTTEQAAINAFDEWVHGRDC